MKKKLVTGALLAAFAATAVTGGTLAFFTDETETKENVFTVGNVEIRLEEDKWVGEGSVDAPEVYPGEALAKDPTVYNDGANPCFVRVKVEGLDSLGNAGDIKYRTNYVVDALGADWVEYNGYYYYCKVVPAKENNVSGATTALFDSIVIPEGLENGDGTTEFSVDVTAYAVQAQGARTSWDNGKDGVMQMGTADVAEIAAWFTKCGMV